jgi:hypothetical protein
MPGLPRLHAVTIDAPADRLLRGRESGEAVGVQLRPWESPRVRPADVSVTLVSARGAW